MHSTRDPSPPDSSRQETPLTLEANSLPVQKGRYAILLLDLLPQAAREFEDAFENPDPY